MVIGKMKHCFCSLVESQDKLQIFLPYWAVPDTVITSESFISFTLKGIWTF